MFYQTFLTCYLLASMINPSCNPGIFGVFGVAESLPLFYFGVSTNGNLIHRHPTSTKIAFKAHPDKFILVTDVMHLSYACNMGHNFGGI